MVDSFTGRTSFYQCHSCLNCKLRTCTIHLFLVLAMVSISKKQCVETGILISILFLVLFLFYHNETIFIWISLSLLFLDLIIPFIFYPFAYLWFGLAKLLGFVSTKVLLTITFVFIVIPIGLLRRWSGRDNLHLKQFKKTSKSVFVKRKHLYHPEDLKNTF